jgi:predicted nucleic acid-binding protein
MESSCSESSVVSGNMQAVFDTNIIIDYLNGIEAAKKELARCTFKAISIISYIETLVGLQEYNHAQEIKMFLNTFHVFNVDHEIADISIDVRRKYKLKVPDAIILATAQHANAVLITRNTKDFSSDIPMLRVPYSISDLVS